MSSEKFGASKHKWAALYRAAVCELDDRQRLFLIARAKGAIFERKRMLAQAAPASLEERQALEDAEYILGALRRAAEFNLQRSAMPSRYFGAGPQ